MRQAILLAGAALVLAVATFPVAAETTVADDDAESVDCFFAENRDDPRCGQTLSVVAVYDRADARAADDDKDNDYREGVDCFFAEHREDPLCRQATVQAQARR